MEQNIGCDVVGDQNSSWLFRQTKSLHLAGATVSYSGDTPFLLHLILGASSERATEFPTHLPLYIPAENDTCLPTSVDPDSLLRSDLTIPFRTEIPPESLVFFEDIRLVCPDVTHMFPRLAEKDLREMAQKLILEKTPFESEPLRRFEENVTKRLDKTDSFQFKTVTSSEVKTVQAVSLSGTAALTIIADKTELLEKSDDISELYDDVWTGELICGSSETPQANASVVLRRMFPELFIHKNKTNPTDTKTYISTFDASVLLRRSLNNCAILLRNSKNGLDMEQFVKWAEAYYQASIILFGNKGM